MPAEFEKSDLERRMNGIVCFGTIHTVDYTKAKARVRLGDNITGWLPWVTGRAGPAREWWPFEPGEQVMVLSPSGEPDQGWILGAVPCRQFPAPAASPDIHRITYPDGAVLEYDRGAHHLKAHLPLGGRVTIVGDVHVAGSITATGDITDHTRSMEADRAIYNAHTHTGDSGGSTSAPKNKQ